MLTRNKLINSNKHLLKKTQQKTSLLSLSFFGIYIMYITLRPLREAQQELHILLDHFQEPPINLPNP